MENILNRTSVREFLHLDVADADVEQLLRSAMAAPSAGNMQPWEFIVIRRSDLRHELAMRLPFAAPAAKAPVVIAVCGNMNRILSGEGGGYWVQDAAAASENLLLSAHALGLGGVWIGVYPVKAKVRAVSQVLELPGNIVPLNLLPVGHPAAVNPPRQKYDMARIHRDQW